jgi:hypothetical protein
MARAAARQTVRAALERLIAKRHIVVEPYRGYRIVSRVKSTKARGRSALSREVGVICSESVYRMPPRFIQVLDLFRAHCAESGLTVDVLEGQRFQRTDPERLMPRLVRTAPKACWVLVLAIRRMQEWFERSDEPAVVYGNVYPGVCLAERGSTTTRVSVTLLPTCSPRATAGSALWPTICGAQARRIAGSASKRRSRRIAAPTRYLFSSSGQTPTPIRSADSSTAF